MIETFVLAACVQGWPARVPSLPEPRDAAIRALTCADALWTTAGIAGRVIRVPDLDGDGLDDVAAHVVAGPFGRGAQRLVFVSSRTGSVLRVLAELLPHALQHREDVHGGGWDAGADFDGDAVPDIVYSSDAPVRLVSGASGVELRTFVDPRASTRFGRAIAIVGDVDGDGVADLVVTAPRAGGIAASVSVWSGRVGTLVWSVDDPSGSLEWGDWVFRVPDRDGDSIDDVVVDARRPGVAFAQVLSGATGALLAWPMTSGGPLVPVGDVDRDGVTDFVRDVVLDEFHVSARVVSGTGFVTRCEFSQLDPFDPWASVQGLGDLDGDGAGEFALCSPNFALRAEVVDWNDDVIRLGPPPWTLGRLVSYESCPSSSANPESGSVLVVSGLDRRVIAGVFGERDACVGVGLEVCALPDVNGDGARDFLVVDRHGAHVFAGPGRTK